MSKVSYAFLILFLWSCGPGTDNDTYQNLSDINKAKFDKYLILGKAVYLDNCSNCHQLNGKGLRGLIPPLAGSDYLKNNQQAIPCLLHKGSIDSITVNGKTYPPQMPAHDISNLELAEVITFINNSWGNEFGFMQVKQVDSLLHSCANAKKLN